MTKKILDDGAFKPKEEHSDKASSTRSRCSKNMRKIHQRDPMSKRKPTNKELSTRFVTAEHFVELANSGTVVTKRENSGSLKREL